MKPRGRSRGRSTARNSSSSRRAKSFEELFNDQQRVAKLRKQVQQSYPKRHVQDLVAWLEGAQVLVDAVKIVRAPKTWDPASNGCDAFTLKRRQLFASSEKTSWGARHCPIVWNVRAHACLMRCCAIALQSGSN